MSHAHWSPLKMTNKQQLQVARKQLHLAVQLPAMFARSYLPVSEEDEHGALLWHPNIRGWCSQIVEGSSRAHQIGLDPALFALVPIQDGGEVSSPWSLDGKTMEEAIDWLKEQAMAAGLDPEKLTTTIPYELEDMPEGFEWSNPNAFAEWAHYFDNTYHVLRPIADYHEGASIVRTWPHHFDMAVLITHDSEAKKFTGVGLSPGDGSYDRPYYYTSPWPYPEGELPTLSRGHWHTEGFTSAVLPMEDFLHSDRQQATVSDFVKETVEVLGGSLSGGITE